MPACTHPLRSAYAKSKLLLSAFTTCACTSLWENRWICPGPLCSISALCSHNPTVHQCWKPAVLRVSLTDVAFANECRRTSSSWPGFKLFVDLCMAARNVKKKEEKGPSGVLLCRLLANIYIEVWENKIRSLGLVWYLRQFNPPKSYLYTWRWCWTSVELQKKSCKSGGKRENERKKGKKERAAKEKAYMNSQLLKIAFIVMVSELFFFRHPNSLGDLLLFRHLALGNLNVNKADCEFIFTPDVYSWSCSSSSSNLAWGLDLPWPKPNADVKSSGSILSDIHTKPSCSLLLTL